MTEPTPGADSPLAFTAHEMRYLLTLEGSEVCAANGRRLGLADLPVAGAAANELVGAGAATLLVRGLAFVRDGRLTLTDETGVVGYVLTHASTWTEIGLSGAGITDGALLLTADGLTLLFTPRPLGVFDVLAVQPPKTAADVVLPLAGAFLDESDNRLAVVRSGSVEGERSAAVMRTDGARWRVAVDIPRPGEPELAESAYHDEQRDEALTALNRVLAP
jgi:hypothetical protein